jgi:hypothetical protein
MCTWPLGFICTAGDAVWSFIIAWAWLGAAVAAVLLVARAFLPTATPRFWLALGVIVGLLAGWLYIQRVEDAAYRSGWADNEVNCQARINESIRKAEERDRLIEQRVNEFNAAKDAENAALQEQLAKKDRTYEQELAAMERDAAAQPAPASPRLCPPGRRATPADDRRVFPHAR